MPHFPNANELKLRSKELQKFSNKCRGKSRKQLHSMMNIYGENLADRVMNIYGENLADRENGEHIYAFLFHLSCGKNNKGIPVSGKANEWCNGVLGSRWCDFEWDGVVRRYAFYEAGSQEASDCDPTLPVIYQMCC